MALKLSDEESGSQASASPSVREVPPWFQQSAFHKVQRVHDLSDKDLASYAFEPCKAPEASETSGFGL